MLKIAFLNLSCAAFLCAAIAIPNAFAGNAATVVFREGHVVYLDDGYTTLVEAYRKMGRTGETDSIILEMNLNGSSFLLDLSQVVIVCRDKCESIRITDPRKTENKKQN